MIIFRIMWSVAVLGAALLVVGVESNYPVFEPSHTMKQLLVPADAAIGSVVYRLRATDPDKDYPLTFAATGNHTLPITASIFRNPVPLSADDAHLESVDRTEGAGNDVATFPATQ